MIVLPSLLSIAYSTGTWWELQPEIIINGSQGAESHSALHSKGRCMVLLLVSCALLCSMVHYCISSSDGILNRPDFLHHAPSRGS